MQHITQSDIKTLLWYDPESGAFRYRVPTSPISKPWRLAGGKSSAGYLQIWVGKHHVYAHRLAVLYMTGEWPPQDVDHIDGCRDNNRWANLRLASRKQNNENQSLVRRNTSGFRGVTFAKSNGKWKAQVGHAGKNVYVGYYDTPEEAGAAAAAKRRQLYTHESRGVMHRLAAYLKED